MNPNLKWRALFSVAVVLLCLYSLFGLPKFPTSFTQVKENFGQQIKLGLDLQGGTHLILQVQVNEAIRQEADQVRDRLDSQLRAKNIKYDEVQRVDDTHVAVKEMDIAQRSAFQDLVKSQIGDDWEVTPTPGERSGYTLTLKTSAIARIQDATMQQSLETISRRINELGLTEPTIQLHGRKDNEILVQLPGEDDPARAEAVIQAGGQLELRLVEGQTAYTSQSEGYVQNGGKLPAGTELVPSDPHNSEGKSSSGGNVEVWYLLSRSPVVTGRDLKPAGVKASRHPTNPGQWIVDFELTNDGAKRFGPFTEANINRQMAIVVDHKVYSAPKINSRIEDRGFIEGNFTEASATQLAQILRAGALPASIKYLEERTVGPSLGADSIRHGVQASVLSLIVVMIFMLIYYRISGANAVVALILNLIILLAFLAMSGAVLTLPGIAGVILTIGMGVDSNVLVFERVREELRNGKSPASAVDAGFDKAFLTIIDTHVTTIVSACFLGFFGTGPIRGFAITLVVGLVANVFTAVFVSKTIFQYHLAKMDRQGELSI